MNAMIHEVAEQQKERAGRIVPWFLKAMPASYFKQISVPMQSQHVQAIATVKELTSGELSLRMTMEEEDTGMHHVTYITSGTGTGMLHRQIQTLVIPKGLELTNVNVFSSLDGTLALNVFSFHNTAHQRTNVATKEDAQRIFAYLSELKDGKHQEAGTLAPKYSDALYGEAAMTDYLKRITTNYARQSNPRRFLIQKELYEKVRGTERTAVHIEPYKGNEDENSRCWVTIAAANVLPEVLLRLGSALVSDRGLDIGRSHMDSIRDVEGDTQDSSAAVTVLRLLVTANEGARNLNTDTEFRDILSRDLKRMKWLDNTTTELGLHQQPTLGLVKAEVITALTAMLHGPLYQTNPQAFSSISSTLEVLNSHNNYIAIADLIAQLFLDRFDPHRVPALSQEDFTTRYQGIESKINVLQNDAAVGVLGRMLVAVKMTLRTNFFNDERYALSLRIDPQLMATGQIGRSEAKPLPFGVFFCHGRHFNAFHCRFRDIARGGLRLVTPGNSDQYALESSRQFEEVYGLSHAQQLKNKDIPEGGAKGVILVNTPTIEVANRQFAMRKAVKAFTDSMLDLIVSDSVSKLVDFYQKDELIYFGPDEQIVPEDIEWIISHAAVRGYPLPDAFMSSKRDNGINHKEFGVTSEGVVVYVDVALRRSLNIDPHKDPFTVKITGGPDGDVAGNLIRILHREYGDNCKVVGIADGFGVAEDPAGLDSQELLRLVDESLPITEYSQSKLSSTGVALPVTQEEGLSRRNSMHFRVKSDVFIPAGGRPNTINAVSSSTSLLSQSHHSLVLDRQSHCTLYIAKQVLLFSFSSCLRWYRVKSDVFIPAGGRPNTINADNWQNFLDADGQPSSKLIVEGANIFITPEARTNLFDKAHVAIVKDSSANKCGVITSSCEVAGSMLLTKDEFMANKEEIVEDVLHQLRRLARFEGELLFKEYRNYPGALPAFSERISRSIGKVTDAVEAALANVQPEDPLFKELLPLIADGLPNKLVEIAGPDRIAERLPVQYQRNAIACSLASMFVYKEGIHLVETQPMDALAERAIEYYRQSRIVSELLEGLEGDDVVAVAEKNRDLIMDILRKGGARSILDIF
eukprot:CAMPEP_0175035864 /NCGR_PEP_ID=MMETSP0005-20121125/23462_1 /TAXON_ID=420556 /ORGANISM="Ochromonas sp., Strain CCMP1393" /LENGTH=1088 /DNA_ID=CAMNT_0016296981 /DNA_START=314 /DNA_END=3581 /DNA_ORIENTATION=-